MGESQKTSPMGAASIKSKQFENPYKNGKEASAVTPQEVLSKIQKVQPKDYRSPQPVVAFPIAEPTAIEKGSSDL